MTALARGLWARLAREVAGTPTPSAAVDEPLVTASFRCARCGGYCPSCAAAPAGWDTVSERPERLDVEALAAALFELELPVDEPGVRRTRLVPRGAAQVVSTMVHTGPPSSRRTHQVARPAGDR